MPHQPGHPPAFFPITHFSISAPPLSLPFLQIYSIFLSSIPPHSYTFSPLPSAFIPPPKQPLLHLSENQTTAPRPTRERGNLLTTIVEICHLGADVTSDLVGRREGCGRGAVGRRGGALQYQGERQGGDSHGCHVRRRPSLLSLAYSHTHTHIKHAAVEP